MDAKDATIAALTDQRNTLETLRVSMTERVASVLKSGDPAQYEALAAEFLTPEVEKKRAYLQAQAAEIAEQLASLPSPP